MDRYEKIEKNGQLGVGTYGVVYKAKDNVTKKIVALKRIKVEVEEEGIPARTLREVAVLKQLHHPNVVKMQDVFQNSGRLYLVFEFVEDDLKKYSDATIGPIPLDTIKSFSHQLLVGLDYCHSRGVMHRDLKPQNILISRDGTLKLADFGIARVFVPPIRVFSHEVVTLWYRSPEVLLGLEKYTLSLDMWAVGTIIAEMARKSALFPGDSEIDEIFKIFRVLGTPDESSWPGVTSLPDWNNDFPVWPSLQLARFMPRLCDDGVDLVERLLTLDPRSRLTTKEALAHSFFADFPASTGGSEEKANSVVMGVSPLAGGGEGRGETGPAAAAVKVKEEKEAKEVKEVNGEKAVGDSSCMRRSSRRLSGDSGDSVGDIASKRSVDHQTDRSARSSRRRKC